MKSAHPSFPCPALISRISNADVSDIWPVVVSAGVFVKDGLVAASGLAWRTGMTALLVAAKIPNGPA